MFCFSAFLSKIIFEEFVPYTVTNIKTGKYILWRTNPLHKRCLYKQLWLLGNVRNMHARSNRGMVFSIGPCLAVITRTVSWEFSQWVCGEKTKTLVSDGRQQWFHLWDFRQTVRTLAEDNVKIRYQETTSEAIEDFMSAAVAVIFTVCKPARLLYLSVVTCCGRKWSVSHRSTAPL
jgi:hypothetical protein